MNLLLKLCLLLHLVLLFNPGHSHSIKKVIEDNPPSADDQVSFTTTVKSQDLNNDSNLISGDDLSSITTEANQQLNEIEVEGNFNSSSCDPQFASFGQCSRVVVPEGVSTAEDSQDEHPNAQNPHVKLPPNSIPTDIHRLAEESNVTIGESINHGDHAIFHGRANCKCGISSRRIVGGSSALIREYPWTVALVRGGFLSSGRPFCGGTLINSRYVVTASHCVDGQSASAITVYINEQDFNSNLEPVEKYTVSQIIMHQGYNRRNIDNDIALLKLSRPVALLPNGPIVPVCLPASNSNAFTGVTATVCGWGAVSQGGSTSSHLRKVDVPVISNNDCNTKTKYNGKITDNMMCAGILNSGGKDSCQGDSGGPLVINNGGRKTLIGVVSWGYGCAQAQAPGVYTRVARYPDWILANTKDADWCEG